MANVYPSRAAAGSILSAVYGRRNNDQRVFEQMRAYVRKLAESLIPGAYLVDIIPALKYAPLWIAKWKREGLKWHQNESERFEGLITEVEEKMVGSELVAHSSAINGVLLAFWKSACRLRLRSYRNQRSPWPI